MTVHDTDSPTIERRQQQAREDHGPLARPTLVGADASIRAERTRARVERIARDVALGARDGFAAPARRTSGLAVALTHIYLPDNRFDWWIATPPRSGGIPPYAPFLATESLYAEFLSTLATVAGARLDEIDPPTPARRVSWDGPVVQDGQSANAGFGVPFTVLQPGRDPARPRFGRVELAGFGATRVILGRVLAQDGEAGPPFNTRPQLELHFMEPQRAIGFEMGFRGARGRRLDANSFRLVARDDLGAIVAEGRGGDAGQPDWRADTINPIGVRHREGAIRSVEVHCDDPGQAPDERLFVMRVWQEPLPASAVFQGTALNHAAERYVADQHGGHPDIADRRIFVGEVALTLPFRCDRAVVFVRGAKLRFRDGAKRPIAAIQFQVTPDAHRVAPGGTIRFAASGFMSDRRRDWDTPTDVAVFFTVVAWDSETLGAHAVSTRTLTGSSHTPALRLRAPHPAPVPNAGGTRRDAIYGGLFAGLSEFGFDRDPHDLERLRVTVGAWSGNGDLEDQGLERYAAGEPEVGGVPFAGIGASGGNAPPLAYSRADESIAWIVTANVGEPHVGEASRIHWRVGGPVLTGRSVDGPRGESRLNFSVPNRPTRRRDGPEPFSVASSVANRLNLPAVPVNGPDPAEMSFLALGFVEVEPDEPMAEIEFEIRGAFADGREVAWQMGGGVDVDRARSTVICLPTVGSLKRVRPSFQSRIAMSRRMVFGWFAGFASSAPEQAGILINDGNLPLTLYHADLVGPDAREFYLGLWHVASPPGAAPRRIARHDLADITQDHPLTLAPGDSLVVEGGFFSSAPGGAAPRRARLVFDADADPLFGPPEIEVVAEPREQSAQGALDPAMVSFGFREVYVPPPGGYPQNLRYRHVLLASVGRTPLLVRSVAFSAPGPNLTVGLIDGAQRGRALIGQGLYQVDPGDSLTFAIGYAPQVPGVLDTRLVIETNAGRFETRVRGEAVP